ncbi:MAG TPA: tungstate ABC transporter substrate-binding protein WtpA [Gemmatimonadaceae bacterium]|nr:tungstate ABC transporter substrate-binding protein WtpA [Gemmatimonadaceae bacterium]
MSPRRLSARAVSLLPSLVLGVATMAATPIAPRRVADDVLVIFNAGSLARPLRSAADSFAAGRKITVQQENAGSLETARKLTELGKIPDIIALADYDVFPQLLMPKFTTWYVQFARNRMVLCYTDKSKHAGEITADNWYRIVTMPGVESGHSDPNLDPAGYRTLLVFQLAERYYKQPGLANKLAAAVSKRNIRPKSADLVALLQTGELDYAWEYESVAQSVGLKYVKLPPQIDLSDPAQTDTYATASVRVVGSTPADTIVIKGEPIIFGASIPTNAPHRALAEQFLAYLLSSAGRGVQRAQMLDVLDKPILVGSGAPASILAVTTGR